MRKLLQELYECERMMKLAAEASSSPNPETKAEAAQPAPPAAGPAAPSAQPVASKPVANPAVPPYLNRAGVSRSVPITEEMRKIIPEIANATHLQHMADKNGVSCWKSRKCRRMAPGTLPTTC